MENYLEETGLIKSLKETIEEEKKLAEYKGDDRVISSEEMQAELTRKGSLVVNGYDCGFPFLASKIGKLEEGNLITVTGFSGQGKCHGKGTKILMYDGSIKNVEDVIIGDKLMGDDSTPRNVLSICKGRDQLYSVRHFKNKTDAYVVNSAHVLSLYNSSRDAYGGHGIRDISVKDFLSKSSTFRDMHKGYKTKVEFVEKKVPLDPYFIGIWLGDGTCSKPEITSGKKELVEYIYNIATKLNLKVNIFNSDRQAKTYSLTRNRNSFPKRKNSTTCTRSFDDTKSLTKYLQELNLLNNKHIPDVYKINSRENRLKLLAGLIDTDGYLNYNNYEIISAYKQLAIDIVYLCRSLGYSTSMSVKRVKGYDKDYYRISICGDFTDLPLLIKRKISLPRKQIKNVLHYGIKIDKLSIGNYYGFEIDGNHRYLLGDFTVTHNTSILTAMTVKLAEKGTPVLWFSYENTAAQFFRKFENVDLPLFYLPMSNRPYDLNWFVERVKEAILKYDIKVIMIDHLHYILDLFQSRNASLDIGNLLRNLKLLAVENNLVIFLVAHTKQPKDFSEPDMGSIRDCLTGDNLIYTDKGEIRVDNLKAGSKILSFGGLNKLKEGIVKNVWETGEKDIYTVRTKTGKEIKCSDGHKFFATTSVGGSFGPNNKRGIRGWTRLKDLVIGDKVYVAGSLPYDSNNSALTLSQASTVGWIIGDGHITERYHTEVTTNTIKEAQYLLHMAGISGTITPYKDKKAFRVYLSNNKEVNWVRDLFKKNKFCPIGLEKNIPGFIKSLGKLEKAAFLRGLFHADGSINKSGINSLTVSLCSISYPMLKDVQHMLLELNIKSWLREKKTHGTYPNSKGTYNLCIYGQDLIIFSHMIGFFCDKQHKLDNLIENFIPKSKKQRNLFFDKIISIEKTGREMTYDIETTTGSFIVNDILTHNSSFIVQESDKVWAVHRVKGSLEGRSKVIVLKDRDHGNAMGQYSEFYMKGNLLEEVPTHKQGENSAAATASRKEGEMLRDLKEVEGLKG